MILKSTIQTVFLSTLLLFSISTPCSIAQENRGLSTLVLENEKFPKDLPELQPLIEESLAWHLEVKEMFTELETKVEKNLPLTHAND